MSSHLTSASFIGFAGGIMLSTLGSISQDDLMRTAILGAIGTTSSFVVTLICKWIYNYVRKRKSK